MRLPTFTKQDKRSRAATCTGDYCTDVAAHAPEARLEGESLDFRRKARVSRWAGVINRSPSVAFVERHRGRHRFIHINQGTPNLDKVFLMFLHRLHIYPYTSISESILFSSHLGSSMDLQRLSLVF